MELPCLVDYLLMKTLVFDTHNTGVAYSSGEVS